MKLELSLFMENLSAIKDKDIFVEELDKFIKLLDKNLTNKELGIIVNLLENDYNEEVDELLLEDLNMTVRVAPPHWIAVSGSIGLSKWDEISQAYTSSSGKVDYHKSISKWKDWEALYHNKPRLKASKRMKMVDLVKERFKDDLNNDGNKKIIMIINKNKLNSLTILDKDGEQFGYIHSNAKYLNDIAIEYNKLTKRNMLKGLLETAVKEKKAKELSQKRLSQLKLEPNKYIGIITTEKVFKEFTSRTYYALKYYSEKKN